MDKKDWQIQYYKKNRERIIEYNKKWQKSHPEKRKLYRLSEKSKEKSRISHNKWCKNRNFLIKLNKINDIDDCIKGNCGLGRKYEKIALRLLEGSIDNNKYNFRGKWDIEWKGLKIDVKAKNFHNKYKWHFVKRYPNDFVDYYLLFCLFNDKIYKILFISKDMFKNGIHVGIKSKYDEFKIDF